MASTDNANHLSMTDASKLGMSELVRKVEDGHEQVIMRSGKPVAVVMNFEQFERLQQLQEDLIDITLVASRIMTTSGE